MTEDKRGVIGFQKLSAQPTPAVGHDDPFRLPELMPGAVGRSFMEVVMEKKEEARLRSEASQLLQPGLKGA